MTPGDDRIDLGLDPDWLNDFDRNLRAAREHVERLCHDNPMIEPEFDDLNTALSRLRAALDRAFVAADPASRPEREHYRPPGTRKVGQNR